MAENAKESSLDIVHEIGLEGLLRANDLASVPALLDGINVRPPAKRCFLTPVVTYKDTEVASVQLEFTENEEWPRFMDKLPNLFPDAPENSCFSFAKKMRSFVFQPNRTYSDWLSAQELDLKVT